MKDRIFVIITLVVLIAIFIGAMPLYNKLKSTAPNPISQGTETSKPLESARIQTNTSDNMADAQGKKQVKAPDFTVRNTEGNTVKLSDMMGKPVVLNIWASWCPPCKSEMPEFNKVFEEMGGDIQFMMVDAVDGRRETVEKGAAFIAGQGYTFPVFYDTEQDAAMQNGIRALPTSIFINSNGYIAAKAEGAMDEETLRYYINMITDTVNKNDTVITPVYQKISPDAAKRFMDDGDPYILLDVRTDSEYYEKHIKGAILIPGDEIADRAESELPDKNALILVYCRSGVRSANAVNVLVGMGYANVYDIGGIIDWPYETETGNVIK